MLAVSLQSLFGFLDTVYAAFLTKQLSPDVELFSASGDFCKILLISLVVSDVEFLIYPFLYFTYKAPLPDDA